MKSKNPAHKSLLPKLRKALRASSPKLRAIVGLIFGHDFGGSEWLGGPITRLRITSDEKVLADTATRTNLLVGPFEPVLQSLASLLDAAGADQREGREFTRRYLDCVVDERPPEPAKPEPPEQPRDWQPDDEVPREGHATVVIEKITDDQFLVVFPNGELIISASKWDAQTAAKDYSRARSRALGQHSIRIDWRGC